MNAHRFVSALVIGLSLVGCAAAQEDDSSAQSEQTATTSSELLGLSGKPGPDTGLGPIVFAPKIDPLRDPIDPVTKTPVVVDEAPVPWKLLNPVGESGCRCHLECAGNDDGSKTCITICYGTGC